MTNVTEPAMVLLALLSCQPELGAKPMRLRDDGRRRTSATADAAVVVDTWKATVDSHDWYGYSLAGAGDVDGNGFDDLIVGAPNYAGGGSAYVYPGDSTGLSEAYEWDDSVPSMESFANSVASVGDVDGDGYDEVAVGTPNMLRVYYGSASGVRSSAPFESFDNFEFGRVLGGPMDVNGDGYSDVLLGGEMRVVVYYGGPGGLSLGSSWEFAEDADGRRLSVASLGDVNADGYDDIAIGDPDYRPDLSEIGIVWVYYGAATGLPATPSWSIQGDEAGADFGVEVAAAGDVDGDGDAELLVGAPLHTWGEWTEGRVTLYRGSPAGLEAAASWTLDSDIAREEVGSMLAGACDVDRDGYDEVLLADPAANDGEGELQVFSGSSSGPSSTPSFTFELLTSGAGDVACAGDVNGDGYEDVAQGSGGLRGEDAVIVFRGGPAGLAGEVGYHWTADATWGVGGALGDLDGDGFGEVAAATTDGIQVYTGGPSGYPALGAAVSLGGEAQEVGDAGDLNGDGYDEAYVSVDGTLSILMGSASGATTAGMDVRAGDHAASAGDIDGDGYDDLLVTVFDSVRNGEVSLYRGSPAGIEATATWSVSSPGARDAFGSTLDVGDANGDGYVDILVNATYATDTFDEEGAVYLYFGTALGPVSTPSWQAYGGAPQISCTQSRFLGDLNGDGTDEIGFGCVGYEHDGDEGGMARVWYGSPSGPATDADWTLDGLDSERFGSMAGLGDVDGDGDDELAVGGYRASGVFPGSGVVLLYVGDPGGLADTATVRFNGIKWGLGLGRTLSSTDVDGDGVRELISASQNEHILMYSFADADDDGVLSWLDCDEYPLGCPSGDADGDGYRSAETGGPDCDDDAASTHPGAADDPSDGVDSDCDGTVESDVDADGHLAVDQGGDDCDDTRADVYPGATETWYDGVDQDCDGNDDDQDGDGLALADDCDDTDPTIGACDTASGETGETGSGSEEPPPTSGEEPTGCDTGGVGPSWLGPGLLFLARRRRR